MPKRTMEQMIARRVREFNALPPERRIRRTQLLRQLLRLEGVVNVVIYGRACYYPTLKKMLAAPPWHEKSYPRYLEVFTSTGKSKEGFLAINEPAEKGTLEHERIPLADIKLGSDQLLKGIEEDRFLLQITVNSKQ